MSSNMFSSFFGKGLKKFANIFWKSGVGPLDIGKDSSPNILNNLSTKPSDETLLIKNISQNNQNNESYNLINRYSGYIEEKDSKKEELDLDLINRNKMFPTSTSFNHLVWQRIKNSLNKNGEELIKNQLRNRVCEVTATANMPREDRANAIQLKNLEGYFLSVLDGHGGDIVAEYASKKLHMKFDEKILELKSSEISEKEKEKEFYEKALEKYQKGEGKYAFVGSCVLCVVVHDNNLFVANLGDCKARLFRRKLNLINGKEEITYSPIKITNTHNASKYEEQKRLRAKFKDSDIIVDKGVACYVKGRLQPTRTLGDFYLKYKEFNDPPKNIHERYLKRVIDNFKGPYIEHSPEVQIFELTEEDEFLVLATDGLWDWLSAQEVADIISAIGRDKERIGEALSQEALRKAASRANLELKHLNDLPIGIRRSIHDDISLLVVDLKNQATYNNKININDV